MMVKTRAKDYSSEEEKTLLKDEKVQDEVYAKMHSTSSKNRQDPAAPPNPDLEKYPDHNTGKKRQVGYLLASR
jgi:hypothetical protein